MYREITAIGAALAIGFFCGWEVQSWRKDKEIATMQETAAEKRAAAQTQAREKEQSLTNKADLLRKDKDVQITNIRSKLDAALVELRKRKERPAVVREVPGTPAACDGASGAELFREDAEFLRREAARADEIAVKLNACIAQYNELRK